MNKIITLIGFSAAGKDEIIKRLSHELNIPIIVSHTTRPSREKETNGIHYNFVSDDFFNEHKDSFVEQRLYEVKNKDGTLSLWKYGIHKDSIKEGLNLAIVDPPGLNDLIKYFGEENIIPFYIFASDETRLKRLEQRGDFKNIKEVKRRFRDDKERFKDFIESGNYYKICNEHDIELAAQEIKTILNKLI